MPAPLEQIEMKIAFLEQANAELGDVVYQQQQQIDALRTQLAEMATRIATAQNQGTPFSAEDEKPPHY